MSSPSVSQASAASPEPVKATDARASEPAVAPEQETQLVKEQDRLLKEKRIRHNRGIVSLSLVNKQLRAMTIEFLPENLPLARLGEPLFRFGKLPERLLAAVRALDCQKASSQDFIVAAPALERLVNLGELRICAGDYAFINQRYAEKKPASDFECQLALAAYRQNASRIKRLSLQIPASGNSYYSFASLMRNFVLLDIIEEIKITSLRPYPSIFADAGRRELQNMLNGCSKLQQLFVEDVADYCPTLSAEEQAQWTEVVHLPTLKSLSITVADPSSFSFIHSWAPNVEILKLDFDESYEVSLSPPLAADQEKPYTTFPSLRKLTVTGTPAVSAVLEYINLDAVKTLELEIKHYRAPRISTMEDLSIDKLVPTELVLPRGSRFDLVVPYAYHIYSSEGKLRARLTEREIDCRLWIVRPSAPYEPDFLNEHSARDDNGGVALEVQRDAIFDALTWAYNAVDSCDEMADAAGVQELAEAVKPVYALMSRQKV